MRAARTASSTRLSTTDLCSPALSTFYAVRSSKRTDSSSATSCLVTWRSQVLVTRHIVECHMLSHVGTAAETKPDGHPFPHLMRAALLLLIPITGCLDAATGNVANVPAPTASVPREAAARRVFSTGLTAPAA